MGVSTLNRLLRLLRLLLTIPVRNIRGLVSLRLCRARSVNGGISRNSAIEITRLLLSLLLIRRISSLHVFLHGCIGKKCVGLVHSIENRGDVAFEVGSANRGSPNGYTVFRGQDRLGKQNGNVGKYYYTCQSVYEGREKGA